MDWLFGRSVSFNAKNDVPALDGKVILVTGSNAGLGKQAVLEYTHHNPKTIWLAARNLSTAKAAIDEIQKTVPESSTEIKILELDLTSFKSIKSAAETVTAHSDRLDILMLNAGIMAAPTGVTKDGYEFQFGTNHMGHALLTKLLIPLLDRTAKLPNADVRIVSLASAGYRMAPKAPFPFDDMKSSAENIPPWGRYGVSKLANILYARQLAVRHPQFTVVGIHPGIVNTNLLGNSTDSSFIWRNVINLMRPFVATVETGVKNQIWGSVAKNVISGEYYEPVGISGMAEERARDDETAERLWEWTEKELEGHGF
ncbi:NAD(P)-binding Rossmann-fold containing protein [Glarea lozoyensis ATCC 20868]|uniref:NAD(P)-binding Rossmann-fold containing protein n=1 Tax=Glarea lozoyensis (strain ATCC 20868 / MF5171) TaxID=1116229 RepID=S3CWQ4_GLAL2|nr:NAD(P)-binding Rossmann-fold containing protein [Glarea lozoyensis ATCC 20868]EPE30090.1 NAD(P)-binding Rossmann-fold containing protein [Glarea lozoyensis ATCC 20868]